MLTEFIGGPLDGLLRELPDDAKEWRVPFITPGSLKPTDVGPEIATVGYTTVIYRRDPERRPDAMYITRGN
jgi:hypothetical protein